MAFEYMFIHVCALIIALGVVFVLCMLVYLFCIVVQYMYSLLPCLLPCLLCPCPSNSNNAIN